MENLPQEIIKQHIFSYLDDKAKRESRVVCMKWSDLINYSEFTLFYTREEMLPDIINRFEKYNKPIGLTFTKSVCLGEKKMLEHIRNLTNLTSLNVLHLAGDSSPEDWLQITHLTNLRLISTVAPLPAAILKNMPNPSVVDNQDLEFLKNSTQIEEFTLFSVIAAEQMQTNPTSPLDFIPNPSKLTKLLFETGYPNPSLDRFTNIKVLEIRGLNEGVGNHADPIRFNKLPALEQLKICAEKIDPNLHNNTALTSLRIRTTEVTEQIFRSVAALTNLRILKVQEENAGRTCYNSNWLSYLSLPNLETLTVAVQAEGDGFSKIQLDPAKLTRLNMRFISGFNFNTITHLVGLQDLELIEDEVVEVDLVQQFKFLEKFSQLTRLTVASAAPHDFSLRGLYSLKDIRLDNFNWDPAELRLLTNLESLVLAGSISEPHMAAFRELTRLTLLKFHVIGEKFDPSTHEIFSRLPHLKFLDLFSTKIDQDWINTILKITTLKYLALNHVFEDETFKSMTVLSNLVSLQLSAVSHSCKYLSYLTHLQSINITWLDKEQIHELEESLKVLPRLYDLQLYYEDYSSDTTEGD